MNPVTLSDIAGVETGLINESRKGHLGTHTITSENQLCEAIGMKSKRPLDEVTNIGAAILKKFKKGDKVTIEASWLKKPRILTVTGPAVENGEGDNKHINLPVVSGNVRPGHTKGGGVMHNLWGDGELTFQPTMQQQTKKITRISRLAANESVELDDASELEEAMADGKVKTFLQILKAHLTQDDQKQAAQNMKRGIPVNIYSLALGLQAVKKVEKAMKADDINSDDILALDRLKSAINREFTHSSARNKTLKAIDKFRLDRKPPKYPVSRKPKAKVHSEGIELDEGVTLNTFKKAVKSGDKKAMRAGAKEYVSKGVMSADEVFKAAHGIDSKLTRQVWDKIVESTELGENIANFGGKQAQGFTSKDNDGKPGIDPEHKKGKGKDDEGKGKKGKEFGGKRYFGGKPKKGAAKKEDDELTRQALDALI